MQIEAVDPIVSPPANLAPDQAKVAAETLLDIKTLFAEFLEESSKGVNETRR